MCDCVEHMYIKPSERWFILTFIAKNMKNQVKYLWPHFHK